MATTSRMSAPLTAIAHRTASAAGLGIEKGARPALPSLKYASTYWSCIQGSSCSNALLRTAAAEITMKTERRPNVCERTSIAVCFSGRLFRIPCSRSAETDATIPANV